MSSKSAFKVLLLGVKFAASANVVKLLKKEDVTDAELAIATKTTKAYKEDRNLQAEVAKVLANAVIPTPEPVKEPERKSTYRGGEPRR